MGYKVFLDTNIFLDHLLLRNVDSVSLVKLCEERKVIGYASSASFYTLAYLIKSLIKQSPQPFLKAYSHFIETIPTHQSNIDIALNSDFKDLEDAFQYSTARNIKELDYLVTNNIKDFKHISLQLPVINSKDLLALFKS